MALHAVLNQNNKILGPPGVSDLIPEKEPVAWAETVESVSYVKDGI